MSSILMGPKAVLSLRLKTTIISLLCCACIANSAYAAPLASLFSKEGTVEAQLSSPTWTAIDVGAAFNESDSIRVGRTGRAGLQFADGGFVRLSNGALLRFEATRREMAASSAELNLESGRAHVLDRLGGLEPEITTPYVSAAARGTEFIITVRNSSTTIAVLSGSVHAQNKFGESTAQSGEEIIAEAGKAPVRRVLVDPVEAVQWTLRLPTNNFDDPILSTPPLSEALALVTQAEYGAASQRLHSISSDASLSADTRAAAHSMLALLAVISNQDAEAASQLSRAQALSPNLPMLRIAQSYWHQSHGDVVAAEHALDTSQLESQISSHPNTQSFFALRRAEVALMRNDLDSARAFLSDAPSQGLLAAEADALRGFLAFQENRPEVAAESFIRAIGADSSLALARFGLGLVRAKSGDIAAARDEFMAAVSLEPTNSNYRSYLGKAYFELGAEDRALEELNAALAQDSQDPTPYLYRSYVELSQNRPIAALRSVEESIARNDNRAVYRSGQLLDQDIAIRSASIGRIFDELGLSGAARNEALRSLSFDYLNYSAHQLLADATDSLNEADASFSEQRIASLLAPLSLNTLGVAGGRSSFNEYSAVFDSAQTRYGVSARWDSRDDLGAVEASVATLKDNWGVSLLYQGGMGDGSKHNDYLRDHRVFGNFEYQAAPESRIRFNLEGKFIEYEDSSLDLQESEFKSGAAELSLTQKLAHRVTWITTARVTHEDIESEGILSRPGLLVDLFPEEELAEYFTNFLLDEHNDEELLRSQFASQIIAENDEFTLIAGVQYSMLNPDREERSSILDDDSGVFADLLWGTESGSDVDIRSIDGYGYLSYRPWRWFTATAGATATSIEYEARPVSPFLDETIQDDHISPKIGLLAEPLTGLYLRTAYFETLSKSSLEDQTAIEPTFIGGFSQRYNDQAGVRARAWASGVDYKIPGSTYLGLEWVGRWLREDTTLAVPVFEFDFDAPSVEQAIAANNYLDFSRQDIVRAYAAQIIDESWVCGLDYQWTELRHTDPEAYDSQQTHRLGGALRYFHPTGFFAGALATWRSQDRLGSTFVEEGSDQFWIFDAELGYRLPRRRGKVTIDFLNIGNHDFNYDQAIGFEPAIATDFAVLARTEFNF